MNQFEHAEQELKKRKDIFELDTLLIVVETFINDIQDVFQYKEKSWKAIESHIAILQSILEYIKSNNIMLLEGEHMKKQSVKCLIDRFSELDKYISSTDICGYINTIFTVFLSITNCA